jgi:hypothetical protein
VDGSHLLGPAPSIVRAHAAWQSHIACPRGGRGWMPTDPIRRSAISAAGVPGEPTALAA